MFDSFTFEQKISKKQFLDSYYDFLKQSKNIPVDILNSKIEIIDILHLPVFIINSVRNIAVEVDIGKDRRIQHYAG